VIGAERTKARDFNKRYAKMRFPKMLNLRGQDYNAEWVGVFYEALEAELKELEKLCQAEIALVPPEALEMGKYGREIGDLARVLNDEYSDVLTGIGKDIDPVTAATEILKAAAAGRNAPPEKDKS
jgi:hypothetical protein